MGGIEDAQAGSTKRRGKKAIAEGFLTRVRREIKGRSCSTKRRGAEPRFLGQGERMRLNARPKGEEISEKLLVIISLYIISLYMSLC